MHTNKMKIFTSLIIILIISLSSCNSKEKPEVVNNQETNKNALSEISSKQNDDKVLIDEQGINEMRELSFEIQDMYKSFDKGEYINVYISNSDVQKIVNYIADKGYTVRTANSINNMKNYEKFESFLMEAKSGKNVEAVYYEVNSDGSFARNFLKANNGEMEQYYISTIWKEDFTPSIIEGETRKIKEWEYTSKGFFSYVWDIDPPMLYADIVFFRVKPLSEENLEYSKKYALPIGYQGTNLFLTNWNSNNMEVISYNDLFEYLYQIEKGEKLPFETYRDGIPEILFETITTKYINVDSNFLKENAVYDTETEKYFWTLLTCSLYVYPMGYPEVVDSKVNSDGTVTLIIDAVFPEYRDERYFTHEVLIKENADGGFKYLSNKIYEDNKENVPVYEPRALENSNN